jgi:alkanesulfonate monooxygenase SsuD/methylene tetrahydromethanopterin reductase-like flavin-dependent oxidoreductase (luciferase family)
MGPAPLRVDLFLVAGQFGGQTAAAALRDALEHGIAAERAGFDGVWIAEHHFVSYGVCPAPLVFAAHLAGRTTRIRVGTAACLLPLRHPVAVAEEALALGALSGGRLDLGVARGGPWVDLEVFGAGLDRYATGFPEALDLLLACLAGTGPVRADGEHFRFRPVTVVPAPAASTPVWVAATSDPTVETAAARGLPLLLGMQADDADKRRRLQRYAAVAVRHGHDPAAVPHAAAYLCDATGAGAGDRLRASMPAWLASTAQHVRIDGTTGPARDLGGYVERLLDIHPVGSPERCVERLAASAAATGIRRLLLMVEGGGCAARTGELIARLGAEVLPALRTAAA